MPGRLYHSAKHSAKIDQVRYVAVYLGIAVALLGTSLFFVHDARLILADHASDDTSVAVLEASNRMLHDLEDIETRQRGYLLTSEDSYLQPYRAAVPDLNSSVLRLRRLVSGNAQSELLLKRIEREKNEGPRSCTHA